MASLTDALREPIRLAPNRPPRFYRGGRLLDEFRGAPHPADDDRPEDWLGSATRSWPPVGQGLSHVGLSQVELAGRRTTLAELLRLEPEALAGRALTRRFGATLGVLVKLLDAGQRLPVHCHPTREAAAAVLGSSFGKTEAWLILGTRPGEQARVWAGFRRDVSRDELGEWIAQQQSEAMLQALVAYDVAGGDCLFIPGGTPHAIGAGVFLLELQEPTDYSVVAETRGFPINARDASLGLGWARALDFFDRAAAPDLRQAPRREAVQVSPLLGVHADPYFRALHLRLDGEAQPPFEPSYAVGVVLGGRGLLRGVKSELELRRGVTFALPAAAVATARILGDELELVWCLGPDPATLA